MPEQNKIGLRELIDEVKAELCQPHSNPMFTVEHIDLEISLTAERDLNGKVSLRVIEGGAAKKSTAVQVVKVALTPYMPDSSDEIKFDIDESGKIISRHIHPVPPQVPPQAKLCETATTGFIAQNKLDKQL